MDLEYREYQYLDGAPGVPQVRTARARIRECGGHGYQVEFRYSPEEYTSHLYPTLVEARAAIEAATAGAEIEIERARQEVRRQILAHCWWAGAVGSEDVDGMLELASIHTEGVVLIEPHGGYAWAPEGTRHIGRHVRLEIPAGGHCLASAAFALLRALDQAPGPGRPRRERIRMEVR